MPLLILLLLAGVGRCTVLRVPSEYPSIQAAIGATEDSDTILVALGTYAEALTVAGINFVLKGDVIPDTGDYPRPTVDPTTLPNSSSLCCLNLGGGSVIIEDMRFRNGAAMFPHSQSIFGGVVQGGSGTVFTRCVFDSTAGAYYSGGANCEMNSCRFVNTQGACAVSLDAHMGLQATDCLFQANDIWTVQVGPHSHFLRCQFLGNPIGSLCYAIGEDIQIQNCVFGPSTVPHDQWMSDGALYLVHATGMVRDNLFYGLSLGTAAIEVYCTCNDTDVMAIVGNRIVGNSVTLAQGSAGIDVGSCPDSGRCNAVIDSNLFEDNGGNVMGFRGVQLMTDARVTHNRFHRLHADSAFIPTPTILAWSPRGSLLRGNRFDSTGYAAEVYNSTDTLDSQWNWWGDVSGPYNAASNPTGRGDTVTAYVEFSPWCADTMNCPPPTTSEDRGRTAVPPDRYVLSAYPNPFNSATMIHLEVPETQIVRLELFDVLGRRVKELWSGAVADHKEVSFDGSQMSSGVYFVRATNTIWNRQLLNTKLVLLK